MNFGNKEEFSSKSGVRIFSLAVFAILALMSANVFAATTVQGSHFDPGPVHYIHAYTSADQACLGNAGAGYLNTSTINSADTNKSDHTGWNMTFEADTDPKTVYFSLCGGAPSSLVSTYSKSLANNTVYEIDAARINSVADMHVDFTGTQHWYVCTSIGGTKLNNIVYQHFGADPQAGTNAYFFKDTTVVSGNYYVFAKTGDVNNCDLDTTVQTGRLVNISTSADNYGVDTVFSPDTKVTGTIHADFNRGYMWIQGTTMNPGFSAKLTGAPTYTIYYDNPAASQAITIYLFKSVGGFPTLSTYNETMTGYTTGTFANNTVNEMTYKISGNVSDEVTSVQTTIGSIIYSVPTTGASGSKVYSLYIPAGATPTILFKNSTSDTLFSYLYGGEVAADQTLSLAKFYGNTHSGLSGATFRLYEENGYSTTTNIKSVDVTIGATSYTAYAIYEYGAGAGTMVNSFYPNITDSAGYITYEPATGAVQANRTVSVNYGIRINGTVSTGISTAGAVVYDTNNNSAFTLGSDAYTNNSYVSQTYRLYVTDPSAARAVLFYSNAQISVLELNTTKTVTTNTTVNVGQVGWTAANIHPDLNNTAGGSACGGALQTCQLLVTEVASPATTLSSQTRLFNETDIQFYEVPNTLGVDFNVRNFANDTTVFYVYNYPSSAGNLTTFEPYSKLTPTLATGIVGISITGGTVYTYRDSTSTYLTYVDKTESAAATYTYNAYSTAFTVLELTRNGKSLATNGTWNVSSLTLQTAHDDLVGVVDPFVVHTGSATNNSSCAGASLSTTTAKTLASAANFIKYFEWASNTSIQFSYSIASLGANTTCINTLTLSEIPGENDDYLFSQKSSGAVPTDITTVFFDTAQGGVSRDVNQATTVGGTNNTYAIYWAGDTNMYMTFNDTTSMRLNLTKASTPATTNVGKVSGSSDADLTTAVVYSGVACTSAVSTELVNPGTTYAQYFNYTGSVYLAVSDGTYTTCKRDALSVGSNMEAYESFTRVINGTVPDISEGSPAADLLSVNVTPSGTTLGYTVGTVDGGATAYKMYINATGANSTTPITFHDAINGGGNTLLSLIKDFSANATVNVSAAYGIAHDELRNASDRVAICYGTMPTNNSDCITKASTATVNPGVTYEIFFEQVAATSAYFLRVLDADPVNYYSWNNFTSVAGGTISNIVLSGKYSGLVRQVYDPAKKIGNVLVKLYTNSGDPDGDLIATTYTYDAGTIADPTGNYVMYGTTGTTYDSSFSKASYITQAGVDTGALNNTDNIDLVSGIAIHVITQETGTPTNITDAIVSILNCTDAATCNADTALGDVCTIAGVANQPCTITGNGALGNGSGGMYYFAGIPDLTRVKIKVQKTGYSTYSYPSAYDDPLNNAYNTSSTAQISKTVEMTQAVPAPVITNSTPVYSATPYNLTTLATAGGIKIKTDVAANCTWDVHDANFTNMPSANVFTTFADTLTTLPNAAAADGLNLFYVRCKTIPSSPVEMVESGLVSFNYDATAPTYELVSVASSGGMSNASSNASIVYAKAGDTMTVKFTSTETITGAPTVTIGGTGMTYVSYLGGEFIYTFPLVGTEVTTAIITISGGADSAGNAATAYSDGGVNAEFDFTAPSLSAPLPTTTQNSKSFLVSVNGSETGITCRYSTSNVAFAAMEGTMVDLGTNVYQASALVLSDGSKIVYFACRDLAGNVNTTNTGAFTVASTAPTVNSITPQGGYQNSNVVVTVNTSAAANCSWSATDGTSYAAMTAGFISETFTHTAAVTSSQQGLNHIYVLCSANGVNMTSSVMAYYTYDSIVPSVYDWGTYTDLSANTTKVWIFASEALNSSSLRMTFNGNNMDYFFGNGSIYTYIYNISGVSDGTYDITVSVCTDLAGNACVLEPVYIPMEVVIDRTAPTAVVTYNSATWMLSVITNQSAMCKYSIGTDVAAYNDMPYAMSSDPANYSRHMQMVVPYQSATAYYVYVKCEDYYGNEMSASENVSIAVDTVAPSIIGSAPSGIYTSLTAPTLYINTSEAATCKYSASAFNYSSGGTVMSGSALTHASASLSLVDGTYSYYVLCNDTAGNIMASGFPITFVVNTVGNFNYTYSLNLGWNSFWLPRIVMQNLSSFSDGNYTTKNVLETKGNLTGNYTYVYYRNGTSCSSQNGSCWLSYDPTTALNDLAVFNDWDNLPYWINMNASGKRLAFT